MLNILFFEQINSHVGAPYLNIKSKKPGTFIVLMSAKIFQLFQSYVEKPVKIWLLIGYSSYTN